MQTQPCRKKRPARIQRRGISIILVGVVLVTLVAFVSLAVDIGRLRLADAQLQTAADAAARAAAFALPTRADTPNTSQDVINEAVSVALENPSIGSAGNGQRADGGVVLNAAQDVHFGFWNPNTHVFTAITDNSGTAQDERRSANAVQVETWRTASRGNPVKLIFAPVIGVNTKNAYAKATAYITGGIGQNFGFIGLQSVSSNGNTATVFGGIASDGTIDLGNGDVRNTATVVGDARPGEVLPGVNPPPSLQQKNNSVVSGWTANLDYQLTPLYPPVLVPPPGATALPSTGLLTGGSDLAHQGVYKGNIAGTCKNKITVSGYVRIYCTTTINLKSIQVTWTNPTTPLAARLEYYMTGTSPPLGAVGTNGNRQVFAHVYAPQCVVNLGGTADFTGWAIGKTLSFQGNSTMTYDGTQTAASNPPAYTIHLVQ